MDVSHKNPVSKTFKTLGSLGTSLSPPLELVHPENSNLFGLRIIQQAPSKTVYRRILKPFPTLALIGTSADLSSCDNLFVEATLLRSDCARELPLDIEGNRVVRISRNECAVFKKLKIASTSQQMGTLVRLKFSLKRFVNNVFEPVDNIHILSDPIEVFSHILYLNDSNDMKESSK